MAIDKHVITDGHRSVVCIVEKLCVVQSMKCTMHCPVCDTSSAPYCDQVVLSRIDTVFTPVRAMVC